MYEDGPMRTFQVKLRGAGVLTPRPEAGLHGRTAFPSLV